MSRKPRANGEPAASHILSEGVRNRAVARSIAAG